MQVHRRVWFAVVACSFVVGVQGVVHAEPPGWTVRSATVRGMRFGDGTTIRGIRHQPFGKNPQDVVSRGGTVVGAKTQTPITLGKGDAIRGDPGCGVVVEIASEGHDPVFLAEDASEKGFAVLVLLHEGVLTPLITRGRGESIGDRPATIAAGPEEEPLVVLGATGTHIGVLVKSTGDPP
jgi:hypothetical protein